jgi:hypothetical protein
MKRMTEAAARGWLSARLLLRDLGRRRAAVAAMLALPVVLELIVVATSPRQPLSMTIAALTETDAAPSSARKNPLWAPLIDDGERTLDQRAVSLVFLGGAGLGFLAAFAGFYLVHHRVEADRRLAGSGFGTGPLFSGKLLALAAVVLALAAWQCLLLRAAFVPARPAAVGVAYVLLGLGYGSCGLLAGVLVRNELAGTLALVLLSNVDVGWLQNPMYYAASESRWLIRALPGHQAVQAALVAAFDQGRAGAALGGAAAMALGLTAAAAGAFHLRVALPRPHRGGTGAATR